ncbi:Hypothetical protein FKW44_003019 [Caligus rogercresseyi]|uniref:Uncharacterized protein n=1 Tax=Caligus rogercresseyi TaxID=217165 RepID=A0A7T8KL22_CALRO|nr:Hypothetical protein FKW44_003019 [Caligus rogercresseyi]
MERESPPTPPPPLLFMDWLSPNLDERIARDEETSLDPPTAPPPLLSLSDE